MDEKNIMKSSDYNSKLYTTCQYIIENIDSFKDFIICKNFEKTTPKENKFMNLHNTLISSFKFLSGKADKKTESGAAKGSDIMPALNLESLPPKKIAEILSIFYEYLGENRKTTVNLSAVDVEKTIPLLNTLIEKLNFDYIDCIQDIITDSQSLNKKDQLNEKDYCKALDRTYNVYKESLLLDCERSLHEFLSKGKYRKIFPDMSAINIKGFFHPDTIINFYYTALFDDETPSYFPVYKNMCKLELLHPEFGELIDIYYVWLFCDLCCHTMLTYITDSCTLEKINTLNSMVLDLIQEYPQKNIEVSGTPEEVLFYLTFYYYKKDLFLQDVNILKDITEKCKDRKNPEPEYDLSKMTNASLSINDIQKLFTENHIVTPRTFKSNYESCKIGINKYNKKTNRRIANNLINQKAFYREIFIDKTLYKRNRHTSRCIFKDFLKSDSINLSDYFFLNEKINFWQTVC